MLDKSFYLKVGVLIIDHRQINDVKIGNAHLSKLVNAFEFELLSYSKITWDPRSTIILLNIYKNTKYKTDMFRCQIM